MKQTTLFAKLVLLLAIVGALALAGCGGDGGLSAEDQARIDNAETAAELAAAEQAAAEEAARIAAEQQAAAEEAARIAAEQAAAEEAARIAAEAVAMKAAAKDAAMVAAVAAKVQADAAAATVAEVGGSTADISSLGLALAAADRAMKAYEAAMEASDLAATDSTSAADAQAAAATAQAELVNAQAANADAMTYVGRVKMVIADNAAEMTALTTAQTAAMTAATAARQAATAAQAAADKVIELVGAATQTAMDTQTAATAADMAADAAEAASASAQAATMSADAMTQQSTAETQRDNAAAQLVAAQELRREAQIAYDVAQKQKEETLAADLKAERDKAMMAKDDAEAAKTAAMTASDAANTATMNLATLQTNGKGRMHAKTAADNAKTAADHAKTAMDEYTMAMAAETVADAVTYRIKAEAAKTAAESAQGMAEAAQMDAEEVAGMELMIDGKDKSVGGSSVNADAGSLSKTVDNETTITGRRNGADPKHTTMATTGVVGALENPITKNKEAMTPTVGVEKMTGKIGKTLDSSDDMARLMLVTDYLGKKSVRVFAYEKAEDPEDVAMTVGRPREILLGTMKDDDGKEKEVYAKLTPVRGSYYPVKEEGTKFTDANDREAKPERFKLDATDEVDNEAKALQVYKFRDLGDDNKVDGAGVNADKDAYAVLENESTNNLTGDITYTWRRVDIHVTLEESNNPETPKDVEIMVDIADPMAYEHIHFGVWAGLGDAEDDGSQDIDDLGIGFVQNVSGDGMTGADMPNNGELEYEGDWVATVQVQHTEGKGSISLEHGPARVVADFRTDVITAYLADLADLSGDISGNRFEGTKASGIDSADLDDEADFEGTFSGGFYGAKAAEVGGIFDFAASDNMKGGAFRGAFGGQTD